MHDMYKTQMGGKTRIYYGSVNVSLCADFVVLYTFDRTAPHGSLDIIQELITVLPQLLRGLCRR